MKHIGFYIPVLVFVSVLAYMAVGLTLDPQKLPSAFIDEPVPAFDLPPIEGFDRGLSSADFKGEVVLLNVWGSWCEGCKDEHPLLMEVFENNLVPIYGLDWKDPAGQGIEWLNVWGNPYTRIGDDADGRVAIDLGITGAPETFIVDADGIIRYKYIGPITGRAWREEIYPLILELQK